MGGSVGSFGEKRTSWSQQNWIIGSPSYKQQVLSLYYGTLVKGRLKSTIQHIRRVGEVFISLTQDMSPYRWKPLMSE